METYGLEKLGIINPSAVYRNLSPAVLVEKALQRGEGKLMDNGALLVNTGKYTGRSPDDKFIVDSEGVHDEIAWGKVNRPISQEKFDAIYEKMVAYLQNREIFIFDASPARSRLHQGLPHRQRAGQPEPVHSSAAAPAHAGAAGKLHGGLHHRGPPRLQVRPGDRCTHSEAAILVDYEAHLVVICGTRYAGEIKKSVFSVMNYILPKQGVFPMHCSANIGTDGDSAVFFGLSGTGKTTLSADPDRKLIGDDEHGWADDSVFNFEGGCYAKCINLSAEGEPEIYNAIKFGALVENVVMDPDTREFDFDDDSLAVNSRVATRWSISPNAELSGMSPVSPRR